MVRRMPGTPIDKKDGHALGDNFLVGAERIETDVVKVSREWWSIVYCCEDCEVFSGKILPETPPSWIIADHVASTGHKVRGYYRKEWTMVPK
jgi:hypothetical protein